MRGKPHYFDLKIPQSGPACSPSVHFLLSSPEGGDHQSPVPDVSTPERGRIHSDLLQALLTASIFVQTTNKV